MINERTPLVPTSTVSRRAQRREGGNPQPRANAPPGRQHGEDCEHRAIRGVSVAKGFSWRAEGAKIRCRTPPNEDDTMTTMTVTLEAWSRASGALDVMCSELASVPGASDEYIAMCRMVNKLQSDGKSLLVVAGKKFAASVRLIDQVPD